MSLLNAFLEAAPPGTARALAALACAESLTDSVALAIYEQAPAPGLAADDFVSAFKYSGLTEPRNSEWNLAPTLRRELIASPELETEARQAVHQLLLSLGLDDANRPKAGADVPSYLFTEAGRAYHFAGTGNLNEAFEHYSEASKGGFTGAQWLGAKLAEEQERNGVIPEGHVETTFLRAWVMLQEGHRQAAMPMFRQVAATDLVKREVAISLHLIGNDNTRGQRQEAERELRRSIEIREAIGDQLGIAQTLHSLANMLVRQDRFTEAEKAYRDSVDIGEAIGNQFHVAQTLHSLANMLARQDRFEEAEKAYRDSIEIDGKLGNQFGVAQTLHSLANMLARQDRFEEAERAYRDSLELSNQFGEAQTLHSLANMLARQGRSEEAEKAYRDSIDIGEKLRNDNHLAQVLRSYALAIETRAPDRALSLLERSLEINRRRGNRRFVGLVERTIRDVRRRIGRRMH
jgi:tetratricopeptide (TPR) repeat protein